LEGDLEILEMSERRRGGGMDVSDLEILEMSERRRGGGNGRE